MKFTQGPWKLGRTPTERPLVDVGYKADGRTKQRWLPEMTSISDEESDANARLIAAAPEMLEALHFAMDKIYDLILTGQLKNTADVAELNNNLSAAIAKAGSEV